MTKLHKENEKSLKESEKVLRKIKRETRRKMRGQTLKETESEMKGGRVPPHQYSMKITPKHSDTRDTRRRFSLGKGKTNFPCAFRKAELA